MPQICLEETLEIRRQSLTEIVRPTLGLVERVHDRHQQRLLVLEVVVNGPLGNLRLPRYLPGRGPAKALVREYARGRPEYLLPPRRNQNIPQPTRLSHKLSFIEQLLIFLSNCS